MRSSLITLLMLAHERISNYAHPVERAGEDRPEIAGRFVSLVVLSALLVPIFIFQFTYSGYPLASAMMTASGIVMLSSLWVFRQTGRSWVARDVFLGALYVVVTWETFYFSSVYSPGMVWYVAMPVVSVLLGSYRAGAIWLGINCISAFTSAFLISERTSNEYRIEGYDILYIISVVCLAVALFIFILMIDVARARAYRSLREANDAISIRADTDELTGLLNRRAFQETLGVKACGVLPLDGLAVLIFDLDGFKDVNDAHGHDVGDEVIKRVARELQAVGQRHGATVARLGGDEFAILLGVESVQGSAQLLASDALNVVNARFNIGGRTCAVGVSVGISVAEEGMTSAELLRRADVAMYEAKKAGKNRCRIFSPAMDCARAKKSRMANDLAVTLDHDGIEVHYQPVVDSKTRRVLAVEALARWHDDQGQLIPPDEFIPVAEEYRLIDVLGLQVLRKACRDAAAWPQLRLSVNLSPVQFRSPSLVADICRILNDTQFPANRLELEVTEGYLIEHPGLAKPILAELQLVGIKIALDDFGTGYSSIGYLREYKFDRLKVDRSLVGGISDDPASRSIIQATALLAQSLSMTVTAEGVETQDQAELLHLAGCSNLQGYLFGKPQTAAFISELMQGHRAGVCAA